MHADNFRGLFAGGAFRLGLHNHQIERCAVEMVIRISSNNVENGRGYSEINLCYRVADDAVEGLKFPLRRISTG